MGALLLLSEFGAWTKDLSLKIGLVDNIAFLFYILSTFALNVMIYNSTQTEQKTNHPIKIYLVLLMATHICLCIILIII